jgi:hypothetical protein
MNCINTFSLRRYVFYQGLPCIRFILHLGKYGKCYNVENFQILFIYSELCRSIINICKCNNLKKN